MSSLLTTSMNLKVALFSLISGRLEVSMVTGEETHMAIVAPPGERRVMNAIDERDTF